MVNVNETVKEALELIVQAYNIDNLPTWQQDKIKELAEELASEIGVNIRFGGGNLYIVDSEEEDEEDESFLESARAATEAARQDDSLFDGTYSQGDANDVILSNDPTNPLEEEEEELGLLDEC